MKFIVDNAIYVKQIAGVEGSKFLMWCNDRLVMPNPEFEKKERMGKWTGGTPREIVLYEKIGDTIVVPFGCLMELWKMFPDRSAWFSRMHDSTGVSYDSSIKLYGYQEKAVNEALKGKNGILVMPCGSGKTQSGLEIVSRLKGRALWLTHTHDLLNQSKSRAESVFSNVDIGVISAGKVNIGRHITFATVQTMASLDLSKYRDVWDVIVVDECQHCCGSPTRVTQFYKVVNSLAARYKFGLTATPKRADGLERAMFSLLGDVLHEVTREEVADTTCPVKVMQIDTGWEPDYDCVLMWDGTIDYAKVIDAMTHDAGRFEFVMDKLMSLQNGAPVIVLANRVEYLKLLQEEYDRRHDGKALSVCLSGMGNSKKAKQIRKNALTALNEGSISCIFATYQLAKEGLDVPNLKYVVFATPEKDETTVVQAVGRVGRKAEDKEYGTVIDLVDNFGMYKKWASKRRRYYKKIDAELVEA